MLNMIRFRLWKRSFVAVVAILLAYACIRKKEYQMEFSSVVRNVKPVELWEYMSDFGNMMKLNRNIIEFTIASQSNKGEHWEYRVHYVEYLTQLAFVRSTAWADYSIKPLPRNKYSIKSNHTTCFYSFFCVRSRSSLYVEPNNDGARYMEIIVYQCPLLVAGFCRHEVNHQRETIRDNLLLQFHTYGRAAENYEKVKKFSEALKCHQQAIEFLRQSVTLATFAKTLESLKLQEEFHVHQERILRLKEIQFGIHQKLLIHKRKQMAQAQKDLLNSTEEVEPKSLQWAIFKNMEAVDSLIGVLEQREVAIEIGPLVTGVKRPKDDTTVMEELHTLNKQLRELVSELLNELDATKKEADELREKVKYYESLYPRRGKPEPDGNLIDFNSMTSSSGDSV